MKLITMLLTLILVSGHAYSKELTGEELLKMGGKKIQCTVVSAGAYNFIASDQTGKEMNFTTDDSAITFLPEKERLVVGDLINVVYFDAENASGSIDKIHAVFVEFISMAKRDFLNGEVDCILTPLEYRNGKTCFVPALNKVIRFESRRRANEGPYPSPGQKIRIEIKAIPARVGNGYVYEGEWIPPPEATMCKNSMGF